MTNEDSNRLEDLEFFKSQSASRVNRKLVDPRRAFYIDSEYLDDMIKRKQGEIVAKTKRQAQYVKEFEDSVFNMTCLYLEKMRILKTTIIGLPFTNEDGEPVVHGDNLAIIDLVKLQAELASATYKRLNNVDRDIVDRKFEGWKKNL